MKKLLILFSVLFALGAAAQSTTVTSTIIDPLGNSWGYGTVTAVFQNAPGASNRPVWSGGVLNPIPATVALDGTGHFTMSLPSTSAINPAGGTWIFNVCPNSSQSCAQFNTPVLGATLDIEPLITQANAWPTDLVKSTTIAKVYNINQTYPPPLSQGGMLYDTTTQSMLVYTNTGWQPFATVGSGVPVLTNPPGSQTITQMANTFFNINTSGTGGFQVTGNSIFTGPVAITGALTSTSVNGRVEVNLQPGSDLGAQLNSAASAYPAGAVLHLRAGTYTMSTTAILDPRLFSIVGDGNGITSINCSVAGPCIELYEPTWSTEASGVFSEFSIYGSGASNQIGIYAVGGMIGAQFNHIQVFNFNGTSSAGIYIYNNLSSGTQGWSEQNHFYQVYLNGNTIGLRLACNTADTQTCSFGYSYLDIHFGVGASQIGLRMDSGRLYNSYLAFRFNTSGTQTAGIQLNASSYGSLWDSNTYDITGEGGGNLITTASGTKFTGCGLVQTPGFTVSNGNSPDFGGLFSNTIGAGNCDGILPTTDYGSITNFQGTGNTVTPTVLAQLGIYSLFGTMTSSNGAVVSPFVTMYSGAPNIFGVYGCPFGVTSMAQCSLYHAVNNGGQDFSAGSSVTGSVNIPSILGFIGGAMAQVTEDTSYPQNIQYASGSTTNETVVRTIYFGSNTTPGGHCTTGHGCWKMELLSDAGAEFPAIEIPRNASTVTGVYLDAPTYVNNGANIVYRCVTAGTLAAGALTITAGDCGTSTDTGLRVN